MKPSLVPLAVVILISVGLGLYRIADSEPHTDVLVVQAVFSPAWGELIADFFDPQGMFGGFYPPLYFLCAKALGSVLGQSLPALSALSVISLALMIVISWFGTAILVDHPRPWHRFWFSLAVGTSPAHIWWAQTPKYMMFLYTMYAASLLMGLAFLRKRSWYFGFLLAISTSAVVYTHYIGFFFAAAQFSVLSLFVLWGRNWALGQKLVAAGLGTAMLSAPLLPTVWEATKLRNEEGYNTGYEQPLNSSGLVRGYLMEWNFGNALLPDKKGVATLKQAGSALATGDVAGSVALLRQVILAVVAAIVLGAAMAFAAYQAYRHPRARLPMQYLIAVAAVTVVLSFSTGLADRFGYLGFGTWCTLAVLTVGFSAARSSKVALVLQISIVAVFAASLSLYYSNVERKYPGTRLIGQFLGEREEPIELVLIDEWIWNVRTAPHNREPFPPRFRVAIVPSAAEVANAPIHENAFAFFGGLREDVETQLDRAMSEKAGWSWEHVFSWESLEKRERSIHAYRLSNVALTYDPS